MEVCYDIALNFVSLAAKEEIQPLSPLWLVIIAVGLVLVCITAALLGDDDCPPGPNDNPWDFT